MFSAALVVVCALSGCYPGQDKSTIDFDSVATMYNTDSIDYGAYTTYAILDSVLTTNSDGEYVDNDGPHDQALIAQIKEQMNARGYAEETDPEGNGVSLKIICQTSTNTTFVFYDYYPGWGGYWGGGWYYPWYPVTGVSSYSTGTVAINIIDPTRVDPITETEGVVWTAALNGLLTGGSADIGNRIDIAVDQAFDQSPYLVSNP